MSNIIKNSIPVTIGDKFDLFWELTQQKEAKEYNLDIKSIIPDNAKALRHWVEMLNYIKHNEHIFCHFPYQEKRLAESENFIDQCSFLNS